MRTVRSKLAAFCRNAIEYCGFPRGMMTPLIPNNRFSQTKINNEAEDKELSDVAN